LAALLTLGACTDKSEDSAATDGTDGADGTNGTDGTSDGTDGTDATVRFADPTLRITRHADGCRDVEVGLRSRQ
jgi:hypothetical protein